MCYEGGEAKTYSAHALSQWIQLVKDSGLSHMGAHVHQEWAPYGEILKEEVVTNHSTKQKSNCHPDVIRFHTLLSTYSEWLCAHFLSLSLLLQQPTFSLLLQALDDQFFPPLAPPRNTSMVCFSKNKLI